MAQAILLPYTTYQNAPSKPLPKLYDIPDDKAEREAMLLDVFKEYVYDDKDMVVEYVHKSSGGYGDMYICAQDGEIFLYVTFIKEKQVKRDNYLERVNCEDDGSCISIEDGKYICS